MSRHAPCAPLPALGPSPARVLDRAFYRFGPEFGPLRSQEPHGKGVPFRTISTLLARARHRPFSPVGPFIRKLRSLLGLREGLPSSASCPSLVISDPPNALSSWEVLIQGLTPPSRSVSNTESHSFHHHTLFFFFLSFLCSTVALASRLASSSLRRQHRRRCGLSTSSPACPRPE